MSYGINIFLLFRAIFYKNMKFEVFFIHNYNIQGNSLRDCLKYFTVDSLRKVAQNVQNRQFRCCMQHIIKITNTFRNQACWLKVHFKCTNILCLKLHVVLLIIWNHKIGHFYNFASFRVMKYSEISICRHLIARYLD